MSERLEEIGDYDAFCAKQDVSIFKDTIAHWFGERCPEFEEGCYTCRAWKLYDKFVELMEPTTNPEYNPPTNK